MDPLCGHGHAASDMLQARTGVVADLLLGNDTPVNLPGQLRQRLQRRKQRRQRIVRRVLPVLPAEILYPRHVFQQRRDVQKLRNGKGASDLQGPQAHAQLPGASEGNASLLKQPGQSVRRFLLGALNIGKPVHGDKLPAEPPPRIRGGMLRKPVDDLIIFKGFQYFFVHGYLCGYF